jgi:hypothetical protein
MTRIVFVTFVMLMLFACPPGPSGDGGTGGGRGGGSGGGTGASPFTVSELDGTAREASHFAIAVDPVAERIGVAYFTAAGTSTIGGDGGVTPDYDLKYLEWSRSVDGGTQVSTPEKIVTVQRVVGVTAAFDPANGEPVVGYLGGPTDLNMSIFWFQNDAVVSRRSGGTWTESSIATTGGQNTGACAMTTSGVGSIIGLWPASAFGADGRYYQSYRDVHSGQFPQQDWGASDMELWEGTSVPPTTPVCVKAGGDDKQAWGGHQQMTIGADDQPALVSDQIQGSAAGDGANVVFARRQTSGVWTPAAVIFNVGNTQTGPSVSWDETEGFGIAVVDKSVDELSYLRLPPGGTQWYSPDPVYGQGSGGWYPTLAMDPINHEPAIAFYVCSPRSGVNESSCAQAEDTLLVSQRIAGNWREVLVDAEGGYHPHIAFFASGKRVVVYRQPSSLDAAGHKVTNAGAVKIAVER